MTGGLAVPPWIVPSFQTVFAQLQAGIRPAVRSKLTRGGSSSRLRAWARRIGLFAAVDQEGFFALARSPSAASRTLRIDRRPGRHEVALGQALGYPLCCCRAAARRGEASVDAWAVAVVGARHIGPARLIHPGSYGHGGSLVSHVPCSPGCRPSLQMALLTLASAPHLWPTLRREGWVRVLRV
jgi:hypothetical protein